MALVTGYLLWIRSCCLVSSPWLLVTREGKYGRVVGTVLFLPEKTEALELKGEGKVVPVLN